MPRLMKVSHLVFDFDLYPRQVIDTTHVRRLMTAEQAGAEFPPILADTKSKRIVDGFHRATCKKRLYGKDATILVALKRYASEGQMLLDAIRFNNHHGLPFDACDKARAILLCAKFDLDDEAIAGALSIRVDQVQSLRVRKTAIADGKLLPIKNTIRHKAGGKLTVEQVEANDHLGGMSQLFYVNQVITLIETRLLDVENTRLMDRLSVLKDLLEDALVAR